jgi:hypothetical protein
VLNRNNHHTLDAKDHDGSMSHLGQKLKSSMGAYVFRSAPNNGHRATTAACSSCADSVAKVFLGCRTKILRAATNAPQEIGRWRGGFRKLDRRAIEGAMTNTVTVVLMIAGV